MKRTKILLTFILLVIAGSANAQKTKIKYRSDVQVGYSYSIGMLASDRINVHMINGVRINKYVSSDVGLGVDYYYTYDWYPNDYVGSEMMIPIFLDARGYLPVSQKTNLFLSMDLDCSIGVTEGVTGMSGFMMTPAVGASFNDGNSKAIMLSLGCNYQNWASGGLLSINANAIIPKVRFTF